ncbi:hypothetical protein ABIE37_000195 [Arthrobacter bambusae]|uniref:Uncharacterized protein n=1 Tax=Arthrobacter bambusae TaxID=1338426 RepID=A0ABV2P0Z9_9MICC
MLPSHRPIPRSESAEVPVVVWDENACPPAHSAPDWSLLIGFVVDVRRHGYIIRTGRVEDATTSGDTVWIAAEGFEGRMLFEQASGYDLRIAATHP